MAEGEHDMVADRQVAHVFAHRLHDARTFMPCDERQRHGIALVAHDHVGVAHAGADDPHQHLVRLRRAERHGLHRERRGLFADNGCFAFLHVSFSVQTERPPSTGSSTPVM